MDEIRQTCKSFEDPGRINPVRLPPPLGRLLTGKQLYAHLGETDLREMAKFTEIPNIEGLAAHAIARRAPVEALTLAAARQERGLSERAERALERRLAEEPTLLMRGRLAGASASPIAVQVLIPQGQAHLAAALRRMLWPLEEDSVAPRGETPVHYTLFCWPEPLCERGGRLVLARLVAQRVEEGIGFALGYDDPCLLAAMLAGAARRRWSGEASGMRLIESGEGLARMRIDGEGLAFFQVLAPGAPLSANDRAASLEPLCIDPERRLSPLWRHPLLPAEALAGSPPWRRAALAVGALPLGVPIDNEGIFTLFSATPWAEAFEPTEASELDPVLLGRAGWIVVPREAIPAPYLRQARSYALQE